MTIAALTKAVKATPARSAWARGVKEFALDFCADLREGIRGGYFYEDDLAAPKILARALLNGADSWGAYSWGGNAYIYDRDIAVSLCTPSELKRTRNGQRRPNAREAWLDVQARALYQAAALVKRCAADLARKEAV